MDLTQITAALSAAAPYSAAITALADLGIDTEKLISPDTAQSYEAAYQSQLADLVSIVGQPDGDDRADSLSAFVQRVCLANGTPALGLSGDITIPLSHFLSLANDALIAERERSVLNEITLGGKQATPLVGGTGAK